MPLEGLFEAMQAPGSMGERRGYLRLGAHPRLESVLFTLDLHGRCGPRRRCSPAQRTHQLLLRFTLRSRRFHGLAGPCDRPGHLQQV